jgi:hypothetical protein
MLLDFNNITGLLNRQTEIFNELIDIILLCNIYCVYIFGIYYNIYYCHNIIM